MSKNWVDIAGIDKTTVRLQFANHVEWSLVDKIYAAKEWFAATDGVELATFRFHHILVQLPLSRSVEEEVLAGYTQIAKARDIKLEPGIISFLQGLATMWKQQGKHWTRYVYENGIFEIRIYDDRLDLPRTITAYAEAKLQEGMGNAPWEKEGFYGHFTLKEISGTRVTARPLTGMKIVDWVGTFEFWLKETYGVKVVTMPYGDQDALIEIHQERSTLENVFRAHQAYLAKEGVTLNANILREAPRLALNSKTLALFDGITFDCSSSDPQLVMLSYIKAKVGGRI